MIRTRTRKIRTMQSFTIECNTPDCQCKQNLVAHDESSAESSGDPSGVTVLCAELPCWEGDETWTASAEQLAERVMDTLRPHGFDFPPLAASEVRRIPKCYPVYEGDYRAHQAVVEGWADRHDRIIAFGRQALFATDNTHHVLQMGWDAAGVVGKDGTVDRAAWNPLREGYRTNVVED